MSAALGGLVLAGHALAAQTAAPAPPPTGAAAAKSGLEVIVLADGGLGLRDGGRFLGAVPARTPARLRGPATVKEALVEGRRLAVVRVPSQNKATVEAWVGLLEPAGGVRALWTGLLGPQDADGETTLVLEVAAEGVVLYESAARVTGCDGAPVRIAARRLDFERGAFAPLAAALPAPATQKLTARRGAARPRRPRVAFAFGAASAAPADASSDDARALVAPLSLSDGDLETAWVEKGGPRGTGGILTARASGSGFAVSELALLPGDVRSTEAFAAHGRARVVTLVLGPAPEQRFDVVLEDSGAGDRHRPFVITLPRPVTTSCVSLQAREIIRGRGPAATVAWTEATVYTDLDSGDGAARVIAELGGPTCSARLGDVATLGANAGPKLVAALLSADARGPGRQCLLEALLRQAADKPFEAESAAALGKALPQLLQAASSEDEALLLKVVRQMPTPPVDTLGALLDDAKVAEDTRSRAARALFALSKDEASARLVRALGAGGPSLRAELRRLSAASAAAVGRLTAALRDSAASEVNRRADLAAALGAAARNQGSTPEAGALLRDLAADPGAAFLVRGRAVEALGTLGTAKTGPGDVALAALEQLGRDSEPTLRLLVTRALATAGRGSAARVTPGLRRAVGDADPAVRAAAAEALGALGDTGASGALISAAKQEPWPMVRRAEVEALGRLCGPGAGDLLARAVERDHQETADIRRSALRGLFACRDGRARALALAVLERENDLPALRTEAALWLGKTGGGDRGLSDELAARLRQLIGEAQADLALEATAFATLNAVVAVGGPPAFDAAQLMRSDPRPTFRRAGAQALGQLCGTSDAARAATALREAVRDSDESVASVARAALRRCPPGPRPSTAPSTSASMKAQP